MEFYVYVGSIGIIFVVVLFLYLRRKKIEHAGDTKKIRAAVEHNIRELEECECSYRPDMTLSLRFVKNKKEYNKIVSKIDDEVYRFTREFEKLRYDIERRKFGEFFTASDIFKLIIGKKEDEDFEEYIKANEKAKKKIKSLKSRKKEIEHLMQDILCRSIDIRNHIKN